ncbi:hypothetical protein FRC11_014610, partial [Ceratobasidium sp. 423]
MARRQPAVARGYTTSIALPGIAAHVAGIVVPAFAAPAPIPAPSLLGSLLGLPALQNEND